MATPSNQPFTEAHIVWQGIAVLADLGFDLLELLQRLVLDDVVNVLAGEAWVVHRAAWRILKERGCLGMDGRCWHLDE